MIANSLQAKGELKMKIEEKLANQRRMFDAFKEIMAKALALEDVDILFDTLVQMGYFDAPASTKFHGAYEGGLFDHSLAVTKELLKLTEKLGLTWRDPRSPYIVGMLHDLCKCDSYILKDTGDALSIEYNKDQLLTGHGDKSVILAQKAMSYCTVDFPCLTDEEIHCIRWHMGAFDDKSNWNAYNKSIEVYPNVLFTHTADMIASQIQNV